MADIIRNPKRQTQPLQLLDDLEEYNALDNQVPITSAPVYPQSQFVLPQAPKKRDPNAEVIFSMDEELFDAEGQPQGKPQKFGAGPQIQAKYTPPKFPEVQILEDDISPQETAPGIGQYILMVSGEIIDSGSLEKIESRAKQIVYEEDPLFEGIKVNLDDIVVLKRVSLKVGVFIAD